MRRDLLLLITLTLIVSLFLLIGIVTASYVMTAPESLAVRVSDSGSPFQPGPGWNFP